MKRYGKTLQQAAENLSFGQTTGKDVVLQLIIDDNVKERGHRNNIFNPLYRVMGCFTGEHKKYKNMAVIDYVAGYEQGEEVDPLTEAINAFKGEKVDPPFVIPEEEIPEEYEKKIKYQVVTMDGLIAKRAITLEYQFEEKEDGTRDEPKKFEHEVTKELEW